MDHLASAIMGFILGTICDGLLALAGKLRRDWRALCLMLLVATFAVLLWRAGHFPGWTVAAAPVAFLAVHALLRCWRAPADPSR